jgi:hypothetical protein
VTAGELWTNWPDRRKLIDEELAQVCGARGVNRNRETGERWPTFPPLTDAECDDVHPLLGEEARLLDAAVRSLAHALVVKRHARPVVQSQDAVELCGRIRQLLSVAVHRDLAGVV